MQKNEPISAFDTLRVEVQPEQEGVYHHGYSSISLWAAFSFAVILGFSRLSYGLLLPSIRSDLNGSYSVYGLVGTANYAGYLIGTLGAPFLLARFGNRLKVNLVALVGMNLTLLLSAFSLDLWQLGFWRLLIGIFSALATVLTMALTLERIYPLERGRATGLTWMGGSLGIVISGLIAPVIISTGSNLAWRLVWIVMALAGLVAAIGTHRVLSGSHAPNPATPPVSSTSTPPQRKAPLSAVMAELFQPRGLLFITLTYFAFGFSYIIYSVFFISLLKEQGMPETQAGLVWAATGFTGVLGSFMWGKLIDRWPSGFTLAVTLLIGALGAGLILTQVMLVEFLGAAFMGLALIGCPVIVTVLVKRAVPAERYTSSFSFITAIFALGQTVGPLVGGVLVDNSGLAAGIALTAIIMGLAVVLSVLYALVQKK
jgi:MFS family permease